MYNEGGEKIGTVEDIVLDKQSNQILFAALGFGGVLGLGEKYYPVPWSLLDYDEDKGGYVVPLNKDLLKNAPAYDLKDLTKHDGSLGSRSARPIILITTSIAIGIETREPPPKRRRLL